MFSVLAPSYTAADVFGDASWDQRKRSEGDMKGYLGYTDEAWAVAAVAVA